ncbi:double-stranded DNA-binding domain-containing protein [Biscogniauxia marginata]|nr:double-stranded DNA-binding domain-containing protein [Biscogniauxia marginata]
MADAELEQIRKARLEQLKAQGGGGGGPAGGQGGPSQAEQQKHIPSHPGPLRNQFYINNYVPLLTTITTTPETAEARQSILNQILHPEAADRLGRIRLVKEQRAVDVENRLITLARTGQLRQKVTEAQLKDLLSAVAETHEQEKIVVDRRKAWDDEDDDLLDL